MLEETVVIVNKVGLHARPAALLVKTAGSFACDVAVEKNDKAFNAKSIMSIMSAAIKQGDTITVRVNGEKEAEALAAIIALIKAGFNEG
jgi:phosphocarrier protein